MDRNVKHVSENKEHESKHHETSNKNREPWNNETGSKSHVTMEQEPKCQVTKKQVS